MKGRMVEMQDVDTISTFGLIPEDTFTFEIVGIKDGQTQNLDPMVNIELIILAGGDGTWEGKRHWEYIILCANPDSPAWKMRWKTKQFLKALDEPYAGAIIDWDSDNWLHKRFDGTIAHIVPKQGKNKGKKKAIINQYLNLLDSGIVEDKKDDPEIPF